MFSGDSGKIGGDVKNAELGIDVSTGGADHPPFHKRTPRWFYMLKEPELQRDADHADAAGGHHLGFVSGLIIAEVFVWIAFNDHTSFLHQDPLSTLAVDKERSGFDPGEPLTTVFELNCSASSAISTPTTMMPTSPTNSRQPCIGFGKRKCISAPWSSRA